MKLGEYGEHEITTSDGVSRILLKAGLGGRVIRRDASLSKGLLNLRRNPAYLRDLERRIIDHDLG